MGIKKAQFIIKGMSRDLAASKFNPELAYENMNMRIVATDDNTTLVLTNEKGTQVSTITLPTNGVTTNIAGIPIGQCILNDKLVLFSTTGEVSDTRDTIYKFWFDSTGKLRGEVLYNGDLNFDPEHPIETLGMYENESLQKVYWVDGRNQPRMINIETPADKRYLWARDAAPFDFVKVINPVNTVIIERDGATGGLFAPGVIQYCMTYYNLYGQESNIFYTSPLYYITYIDRAGGPDEHISNSFKLTLSNLDVNFDYVRVYSILRTSLDATPQARKVVDLKINRGSASDENPQSQTITYIDNGTEGQSIDPTTLFYIGGESLVAGTLSQKDNTLFLGDIKYDKLVLPESFQSGLREGNINFVYDTPVDILGDFGGYYNYTNQLLSNSQKIKGFKYKEYYRFGIQFQHLNGKWSSPVWINDAENTLPLQTAIFNGNSSSPKSTVSYPVADYEISAEALTAAYNLGYRKYRPVVVFPSIIERESICQGVLAPTVYNLEDRYGNIPYAQSSWFFRPNAPCSLNTTDTFDYDDPSTNMSLNSRAGSVGINDFGELSLYRSEVDKGSYAEFRHNELLASSHQRNGEIQSLCYGFNNRPSVDITAQYSTENSKLSKVTNYKETFFVDQSIVTLHSPDIEFDSKVKTLDLTGLKLRIVGLVPITSFVANVDIQTSTPPMTRSGRDRAKDEARASTDKTRTDTDNVDYSVWQGFYSEPMGVLNTSVQGWRQLISAPMWLDGCHNKKDVKGSGKYGWLYVVYPWQKGGSLNNTQSADTDTEVNGKLLHKTIGNSRFSYNTVFLSSGNIKDYSNWADISGAQIFESNEVTPVKLPAQDQGLPEIIYYGNVDKILTYPTSDEQGSGDNSKREGYPIIISGFGDPSTEYSSLHNLYRAKQYMWVKYEWTTSNNNNNPSEMTKENTSTDPISIKYKSTPHAVIALKNDSYHNTRILPSLGGVNSQDGRSYSNGLLWDKKNIISGISQASITCPSFGIETDKVGSQYFSRFGFLWLGELYRTVNTSTIFGGKTQEAFENNQWEIAGVESPLKEGATITSRHIRWTEGDTYYQRYDCLKTYPFTHEDLNSVIDVLSFMCETRINIDGRYDKNRGQTDNLYLSPTNFNLLNPVYSQHNNFFNYRAVNLDKLKLTSFPNSITWTKTKTLGEEVDTWTNINLASVLDLDGDKGPVRAIKKFNDSLITFQDEGLSQILYNENVQIASTTGVPIEIANSGKVTGKRAISNHVGCTNKWSICSTPNGLYFVDDRTKDIYLFNGQMENISDKLGFHSWMVQNFEGVNTWNPVDFNSCITYYDKINQDVLFITKNTALAFNESLNNFTSFYSYEKVPFFGYLGDKAIMWQKDGNNVYKPWIYRGGDYNMFFGQFKPYWTTVVVNPDPAFDKVFNNVEFRADSFDKDSFGNDILVSNHTFDHLYAWNEYQNSSCTLSNTKDLPSTLKKKFRIWHAAIPRQIISQDFIRRDRIRNPWTYLKLSTEVSNTYKTVLHDMIVDYFE